MPQSIPGFRHVTDRRADLCDWLRANGVDPNRVPTDSDLYIETDDNGHGTLHFEQYDTDAFGRPIPNERGDGAARRPADVPLASEPPEWWRPHSKPTREQLLQQLAATQAELDALRQGEEVYEDEATVPTPGQWIWRWNRLTPERRLEVVAGIQQAQASAERCFFENHAATIGEMRARLAQQGADTVTP
jgi:hypothetical protein